MNKIMNKIIVLIVLILFLTGCGENEYNNNILSDHYIYIDKETCVEYFVSSGSYNSGNFTPRYNEDGTLKTNNECKYERDYKIENSK